MKTIAEAVKIGSQKRPRLASRLQRAGDILRSKAAPYKAKPPADRLWLVRSQSREMVEYLVDRDDRSCTCPDYRQHRATDGRRGAPSGWCKHRLAVEMLLRLQRSNGDKTHQDPPAAGSPPVTTQWTGRHAWLQKFREYRQCPNHSQPTLHTYHFGRRFWRCTACGYPFAGGRRLAAERSKQVRGSNALASVNTR